MKNTQRTTGILLFALLLIGGSGIAHGGHGSLKDIDRALLITDIALRTLIPTTTTTETVTVIGEQPSVTVVTEEPVVTVYTNPTVVTTSTVITRPVVVTPPPVIIRETRRPVIAPRFVHPKPHRSPVVRPVPRHGQKPHFKVPPRKPGNPRVQIRPPRNNNHPPRGKGRR